jgi:hypothetical protein
MRKILKSLFLGIFFLSFLTSAFSQKSDIFLFERKNNPEDSINSVTNVKKMIKSSQVLHRKLTFRAKFYDELKIIKSSILVTLEITLDSSGNIKKYFPIIHNQLDFGDFPNNMNVYTWSVDSLIFKEQTLININIYVERTTKIVTLSENDMLPTEQNFHYLVGTNLQIDFKKQNFVIEYKTENTPVKIFDINKGIESEKGDLFDSKTSQVDEVEVEYDINK